MCPVCKLLTSNSSFNPHNGSYATSTSIVFILQVKKQKDKENKGTGQRSQSQYWLN